MHNLSENESFKEILAHEKKKKKKKKKKNFYSVINETNYSQDEEDGAFFSSSSNLNVNENNNHNINNSNINYISSNINVNHINKNNNTDKKKKKKVHIKSEVNINNFNSFQKDVLYDGNKNNGYNYNSCSNNNEYNKNVKSDQESEEKMNLDIYLETIHNKKKISKKEERKKKGEINKSSTNNSNKHNEVADTTVANSFKKNIATELREIHKMPNHDSFNSDNKKNEKNNKQYSFNTGNNESMNNIHTLQNSINMPNINMTNINNNLINEREPSEQNEEEGYDHLNINRDINNYPQNTLSRFMNGIKKVILNIKGQPITNEAAIIDGATITDENVNDLSYIYNDLEANATSVSLNNNINNGINNFNNINNNTLIELQTIRRQSNNNNNNNTRLREGDINTENEQANEIVCLYGLNPNDIIDNTLLICQNEILNNNNENVTTTPTTPTAFSYISAYTVASPNNNNNNNHSDNNNNNYNNNNENFFVDTNILNRVRNSYTNYINSVKEKIKKYWLARVQEANTQLATPNHSTSTITVANANAVANTNTNTVTNTNVSTTLEDENDDPCCLQMLFLLGLICKSPVLWVIGSIIFCITPNNHKKTKKWCLINFLFAFVSLVYFISTTKFINPKPAFYVHLNSNIEQKNIYYKGIIKNNNKIIHPLLHIDNTTPSYWVTNNNTEHILMTTDKEFMNWNFILNRKPDSNILLTKETYNLINRIQVTILFGQGSIYPSESVKKIKHFFENLKNNMNPISFEQITMTYNDIPDDFFGAGLMCENNKKKNINYDNWNSAKWFLFWKENDVINKREEQGTKFLYNLNIPVGEVFYFKEEHACKVAFVYSKGTNKNEKYAPNNFVEIRKIIIKPI
ncbi:conserved protein, unknown function [Hepatocystis sp. ex Piliocolobus tephrosceles]|nr:conserved protein, unknown function [Hepatocystis sp. ex Piliocolobus tephrosceles]